MYIDGKNIIDMIKKFRILNFIKHNINKSEKNTEEKRKNRIIINIGINQI